MIARALRKCSVSYPHKSASDQVQSLDHRSSQCHVYHIAHPHIARHPLLIAIGLIEAYLHPAFRAICGICIVICVDQGARWLDVVVCQILFAEPLTEE